MRFFWALFWAVLLIHMLTYVAGSMMGSGYDFGTANILSVCAFILILIIPAILPDPESNH